MARSPINSLLSRKVSNKTDIKKTNGTNESNSILNTLTLTLVLLYSCSTLLVKTARYFKRRNNAAGYEPINKSQLPRFYGATTSSAAALEEEEYDNDDDQSSSATMVSPQTNNRPWSVYNWLRVLVSGLQVGLVIFTAWSLVPSSIDQEVEGQYRDLMRMHYSRSVFWVNKLTLSKELCILNAHSSLLDYLVPACIVQCLFIIYRYSNRRKW